MTGDIFKKYDIRGRYPEEINEDIVFEIGKALAEFFKKGRMIIGHDVRLSSPRLYQSVIKGLSEGAPALSIIASGLMTTPMFYFFVNKLKARGGIMITASHNPKEYNGMKVVGRKAVPIGGDEVFKLIK